MLGDDGRQAEMVFLQFFHFVVNMLHIFRHPRYCLGRQRTSLRGAKTSSHSRPLEYTGTLDKTLLQQLTSFASP